MAKRKKRASHKRRRSVGGVTRRKTTSRRRRVGATSAMLNPDSPLMMYGPIVAGYLMGDKVNAAIVKALPENLDGKIVAGAEIGLGAMLAFQKKKTILTTVGGGLLLGAGIKKGLTEFGIGAMGGYQMVPAVNGYQSVPTVGSKKVAGYIPGANGMNGYPVARVAVGANLFDSSMIR